MQLENVAVIKPSSKGAVVEYRGNIYTEREFNNLVWSGARPLACFLSSACKSRWPSRVVKQCVKLNARYQELFYFNVDDFSDEEKWEIGYYGQ